MLLEQQKKSGRPQLVINESVRSTTNNMACVIFGVHTVQSND